MSVELPEPEPEGEHRLRVGTAMWANRAWIGRYLPRDTAAGRELAPFAHWCTAVEGNTTFYALPPVTTVARWVEQLPPWFRLVPKLPRTITHDRRLRDAEADVREFCARMAPLAPWLGPVSIQLPPTFGPDDVDVLARFLDRLPSSFRWGVEARHVDFAAGGSAEASFDQLLRDRRVDRIIIDTRAVLAGPRATPAEIEAFERKPRLRVRPVATADQPIVRFIGQTDRSQNPSFWAPWVDHVVRWLDEGRSPIVFLHTPDNDEAPADARAFHAAVRARRPALAALPEPWPLGEQLDLF